MLVTYLVHYRCSTNGNDYSGVVQLLDNMAPVFLESKSHIYLESQVVITGNVY